MLTAGKADRGYDPGPSEVDPASKTYSAVPSATTESTCSALRDTIKRSIKTEHRL